LSSESLEDIRNLISARYGANNLPESPRIYTTKAKNAQEAHEGIRPTSAARTPEDIKSYLSEDQFKLYSLIWKRTIASQMIPAIFDTVALDLVPDRQPDVGRLRANGQTLIDPGFIAVYQEGSDDVKDDEADRALPAVEENQLLTLADIRADQHFTEPPPRYTEASLVKTLEEYGIGRPSTYASIISTLKNRDYVEMDGKRFLPTDVGRVVSRFLTDHFTHYVDYDFTASLENVLDEVSRDEKDWVPVLEEFWRPFSQLVRDKEASVTREQAAQTRQLGTDRKSGRPVSVRLGRFGPFVQIGTRDDEEKPKFAGLKPGQKISTIELDEALELFKLPRKLGQTPEGEPVLASIGRFGPYVRYGDKFVSIRDDDPYTINLEKALEFITAKKEADKNRIIQDFEDKGIQVLKGRYGPYVTDKTKNARVPKDQEPTNLTLEECIELLEKAPVRGRRSAKKKVTTKAKTKSKAKKKKKKKATKKVVVKTAAVQSGATTVLPGDTATDTPSLKPG
jgi:DNA topoisomerase-1